MNRQLTLALGFAATLSACDTSEPASPGPQDAGPGMDASVDASADASVLAPHECHARWCSIGAGTFVMGSPKTEYGHPAHAEDQVTVTLTRPFLIQQYEMSLVEYLAMGFPEPMVTGEGAEWGQDACKGPDCPLLGLTWYEAAILANELSKKHGLSPCYLLDGCAMMPPDALHGEKFKGIACTSVTMPHATAYECEGYRLPTQAEWEYAARAGTTTAFYAGEIETHDNLDCHYQPNLVDIAWYCHNSGGVPHPVGLKAPNAFGLHDILGNVPEWAHGRYHPLGAGDGSLAPVFDPMGDLPAGVESRVARGGIWHGFERYARAASTMDTAAWGAGPGVRLVRTLKPGEDWKVKL